MKLPRQMFVLLRWLAAAGGLVSMSVVFPGS